MKIKDISEGAIESINYKTLASGGKLINAQLPIFIGEIVGLPSDIEALIVTSDLQGIISKDNYEYLLGIEVAEMLPLLIELELGIKAQNVGVFLCGDLFANLEKRGGLGDVKPVWKKFKDNFRWVSGIAGNHDFFGNEIEVKSFKNTNGIYYIDKEIIKIDDIYIAGISGIIGKPDRINRTDEEDYLKNLNKLLKKNPDILLLHQTPSNILDNLKGDENITKIIEESEPTIVFCGHYHWDKPLSVLKNSSQILNVDSRVIILKNLK